MSVRRPDWVRLASQLLGSSVLAQVAVLGATAAAASRLHPSDFATYGIVTGGAWFLSAFNTWSADTRIPAVPDAEALALFRTGRICVYVTSVLLLAAAGFFGQAFGLTVGALIASTGVSGLLLGLQLLYTSLILREQAQSALAESRLVQGVTNAVLLLALLVTAWDGGVILCLSWMVSVLAGVWILWLRTTLSAPGPWSIPRREDWLELRRQVKLQPVASALAGSISSMPLILLPALGGMLPAGHWAVANRFLNPAVNTLYSTLQPIFYGTAAELARQGQTLSLRDYHRRWVRYLFLSAVPVGLLFWGLLEYGLPLLGSQWQLSGGFAAAAAAFFAIHFAVLPLQHVLLLTHHLRTQWLWTITRFIACLAPFALCHFEIVDAYAALMLWLLAVVVTLLLHLALAILALSGRISE